MEAQIYDLTTPFNFGKYRGTKLIDLLKMGQSRYLGYLICTQNPLFILSPNARHQLERAGYFDNLDMSAPVDGGSVNVNMGKNEILEFLIRRYENYTENPSLYNQRINESAIEHFRQLREKEMNEIALETIDTLPPEGEDGPFEVGSSNDPYENPWRDILPDDEADVAYWNTD
jgi:hypothetical protein